jgi:2-dehydropantoate 2-reductase
VRVTVIGAGGVGGYYAGVMARAGNEVSLFARGSHLDAIRGGGLRIRTPDETFSVDVHATDDPSELGGELAIVAVKAYSLDQVAAVAAALARDGADVLPLLNGVDAAERLADSGVPRERILGGLTYLSAFRTGPGVIERYSPFQRVVAGELAGGGSARVDRIIEMLAAAGVEATASEHILLDLWRKLIFLAAMSAACGLARRPIGPLRDAPPGRRLIERAVAEVAAVARASGIAIPNDEESRTIEALHAVPAAMKPSFLVDLESGGPTELDALSGFVSRRAAALGVATPVHDTAVAALS